MLNFYLVNGSEENSLKLRKSFLLNHSRSHISHSQAFDKADVDTKYRQALMFSNLERVPALNYCKPAWPNGFLGPFALYDPETNWN